jgi:hemerythrin
VSNVLNDEKKQQAIALGRLRRSLRRIRGAIGVRRETASGYLKDAGIALRPPGGWGRASPAKPDRSVFVDMQGMFEWRREYSVNIASIDAQHQKLFAIAGGLHEAMRMGQARLVLTKILDRLVQYTKSHFAHEEGLMRMHSYPDLAIHKEEHEALTKQVLDFLHAFQAGDAFISVELMTYLKNWLEKHIKGTDMLYSPFLIPRNVA